MLLLLLLIWLTEKMIVKAFKVHASEKERVRWTKEKGRDAGEQEVEDDGELTDNFARPAVCRRCAQLYVIFPASIDHRMSSWAAERQKLM